MAIELLDKRAFTAAVSLFLSFNTLSGKFPQLYGQVNVSIPSVQTTKSNEP